MTRANARARIVVAAALTMACWHADPPGAPGQLRFAVFGDGPYRAWEMGRFRRVIHALNERPDAFVIHIGDILWFPCSEDAFTSRRDDINRIRHPVIYTPGDNEWADCHERIEGGYDPLDRLALLRRIFFRQPTQSLGGVHLALETQGTDSVYAEFVEHARWFAGGIVFATLHVVGGANGGMSFPNRTAAHDDEVRRRTAAAVAWLRAAFAAARDSNARAVVLAFHAETFGLGSVRERQAFAPLHAALADEATRFARPVLLVHGDDHTYTIDRPLVDFATGAQVPNVQRLETFGSPDIGWVDVVVDTTLPTLFRFEPNVTPRWMWW